MTPNNNLSILPFYDDLQKQNHQKDYAFGKIFPLFTPNKRILPFQIIRDHVNGGYLTFSGDDYINIPNTIDLTGTSDWTILCYCKLPYQTDNGCLSFSKSLKIDFLVNNNTISFRINDGTVMFSINATRTNDWMLLAGTYEASTQTAKFYVDGVYKGQFTIADPNYVASFNNYIGRGFVDSTSFAIGDIGSVSINNITLNEPQIQSLSKKETIENGLIHHWDFDDGIGDTVTDIIGGENGSVVGAVWDFEVDISIILKNKFGTTIADISSQMLTNGLRINPYSAYGYDIIMYPLPLQLATETPEGQYYLELTDSLNTWYSEIFNIVRDVNCFLKILYWNRDSIIFDEGRIDFTNNFKFELYLPTQLGRPEYEFEEQVENRDGFQFIEKQISEKTYRFNFLAPEYLLDAMRIIRMMDYTEIINKGETYTVDQFLITPKWEKGGHLASVEAEFQCNTVIKKIGAGIEPIGGGFNNDFNNDFNIL